VARAAALEEHLGEQHLQAGVLVVPGELEHDLVDAAEGLRVLGDALQVARLTGGLVQPRCRPEEFVLVPGRRRVKLP
jgi:hypothetical protein